MANTPVSIREVAALAGVSLGTVSNVLNHPEVVAERTRARVQAAIKELGFIRNESARQLRAGRVQGILITPVAGADAQLARVQRRGTPVVLVDSRSPTRGQCTVSVDDVLGGDLAVSHLLDTGHTRIAFVGGPMSIRQAADRRDGAIRALERSGRGAGELLVVETPALNVAAGQWAGAARKAAVAAADGAPAADGAAAASGAAG